MNLSAHMLFAWALLALVMAALWWVARFRRNAGIVDVAWALGTGLTAGWLLSVDQPGDPIRRLLLGLLVGLWSLRLAIHLWLRLIREREDGRYTYLRQAAGERESVALFGFFQMQAAWGLMFAIPIWAAAHGTAGTPLGPLGIAGILIWLLGFAGEWLADRQLAQFRRRPANQGQVCRRGLWRYSRHPNYFCEWLLWVGYAVIAVGAPLWWVGAAAVPVMYLFLTRITGIPFTEAQALRSRGEAYADYQRTTSAFLPLPPRPTLDSAVQNKLAAGDRATDA